jgi:hypothetical protein
MKDWKRIVLVVFVLFGATLSFGYWSFNQFDNAFENLSASYIATPPLVRKLPTTSSQDLTSPFGTGQVTATTLSTATSTPISSEASSAASSDQDNIDLKF